MREVVRGFALLVAVDEMLIPFALLFTSPLEALVPETLTPDAGGRLLSDWISSSPPRLFKFVIKFFSGCFRSFASFRIAFFTVRASALWTSWHNIVRRDV